MLKVAFLLLVAAVVGIVVGMYACWLNLVLFSLVALGFAARTHLMIQLHGGWVAKHREAAAAVAMASTCIAWVVAIIVWWV